MSEKCVVTIRVMFNTDQEEKAKWYAESLEEVIREAGRSHGRQDVLDTEITGYSFHGGRSFLYREPSTAGES